MGKSQTETVPNAAAKMPEIDKPVVVSAIAAGSKIIEGGGTKADAAREIYKMISAESKETVVAAFVAGASLTDKGALTYWYNCKRKAARAAAQ